MTQVVRAYDARMTYPTKPTKALRVLTPDEIERFCEALADGCKVGPGCEAIGVSYMTAYRLRQRDPAFKVAWDEALKAGVAKLEDEVHRRAFEGDAQPVFNKEGEQSGTKIVYSDVLSMFLLKAHDPNKYRDNAKLELTGANGGPVEFTDTQLAVRLAAIMSGQQTSDESAVPTTEDGEPLV